MSEFEPRMRVVDEKYQRSHNINIQKLIIYCLFCRYEFRHNPYVGTFQRTRGGGNSDALLPQRSPHVGTFRHAPTIALTNEKTMNKPFRRNFISNMTLLQQVSKYQTIN